MKTGLGPIAAETAEISSHVGHRPQAMDDAQMIGGLDRRRAGDRRLQELLHFTGGSG